MQNTFRNLTIAAISIIAVTSANSQEDKSMTPDQKEVLKTITTMTSNFQAGNLEKVMNTYESEAAIIFEPGVQVDDRAMQAKGFEGFMAVKPKFDYSAHEVIVSGDIAVHFAPWNMTGTAPDGSKIAQSGLSVAVLRKQDDGTWKMVIDNPHGQHLIGK